MVEDKSAGVEVEKLSDVGFDEGVIMEKSQRVEWLDLPTELWIGIAKHVNIDNNTTLEVLRFRSVCKTWRSALPLPHLTPFTPRVRIPLCHDCLLQTKIYRLEPLSHQDPSISSSKGWIIMLGESESAPLRLLNPFTRSPAKGTLPRVLNLINFRAVELFEAFNLYRHYTSNVRKVVLIPSFPMEGRIVCALYKHGGLLVGKVGDEKWSMIKSFDQEHYDYDDIILHEGHLYVMDKLGTICWFDPSSLKFVQFSPSLRQSCDGKEKHMVKCGGSFYMVDMHIQGHCFPEKVEIEVYKFDEECHRWVDVQNLGDVAFILGKDSNFSLSAQDYYGCEGNCIYFSSRKKVFCYNLEDSKLKDANPFWPCPTLFNPEFN